MDIADRANPGFSRGQKRLLRLGRISGCVLLPCLWIPEDSLGKTWMIKGCPTLAGLSYHSRMAAKVSPLADLLSNICGSPANRAPLGAGKMQALLEEGGELPQYSSQFPSQQAWPQVRERLWLLSGVRSFQHFPKGTWSLLVGPWALVQVFVLVLFLSLWQLTPKIWFLDTRRAPDRSPAAVVAPAHTCPGWAQSGWGRGGSSWTLKDPSVHGP